jgi:hypothetical protein
MHCVVWVIIVAVVLAGLWYLWKMYRHRVYAKMKECGMMKAVGCKGHYGHSGRHGGAHEGHYGHSGRHGGAHEGHYGHSGRHGGAHEGHYGHSGRNGGAHDEFVMADAALKADLERFYDKHGIRR